MSNLEILDAFLVVVRMVYAFGAAGGLITVAYLMYEPHDPLLRAITGYFIGAAFYNLASGLWFVLTFFMLIEPDPFWRRHTYTLAHSFAAIPAIWFSVYLVRNRR